MLARRFWVAHLVGVVCTAIAVSLGLWQLDSWQAQREAAARDLTMREPVELTDVMGADDPFPGDRVGQPVRVAGTWVPTGTVFVTDRTQDGVEGSWVVTPLAVDGGVDAPAILVVRGFLDDPEPDPDSAPEPPTGEAELVAWLQPAEGTGQMDPDPSDDLLPQLRLADAIQHVEQDLYSGYAVLQDPTEGLGQADLDALPKSDQSTGLRNLLYALEWWIFAGFVLYIWWRYVRDELERAARGDADHEGSSEQEAASAAAQDDAVASQP
ncbi:hypothetical protein GCM10027026_17660 [Myroides odoratimimus subsp. xuanwuensis]